MREWKRKRDGERAKLYSFRKESKKKIIISSLKHCCLHSLLIFFIIYLLYIMCVLAKCVCHFPPKKWTFSSLFSPFNLIFSAFYLFITFTSCDARKQNFHLPLFTHNIIFLFWRTFRFTNLIEKRWNDKIFFIKTRKIGFFSLLAN